jgi:hypothetical protein
MRGVSESATAGYMGRLRQDWPIRRRIVRKYSSSICWLLQWWRLFTKCLEEDIPDEYGIILQVSWSQPSRL